MSSFLEKLYTLGISPDQVEQNAPMSNYTTFRVGGPADYLIHFSNPGQLSDVVSFIKSEKLPLYTIGNGSNLLVRDGGIRGVVLRIASMWNNVSVYNKNILIANSGITLSSLAQFAAANGLSGLEPISGIPGTLGGAITMNAGAYGREISECLSDVTYYSPADNQMHRDKCEDLDFSYRHSAFENSDRIIISASLTLTPGDPATIREEMQSFAIKRREKQPLEYPSAGSTFKRPAGAFAAKLIDDSGLRGYRIGDAQVSEKHCGFVVNRGHATASEILTLMAHVKEVVHDRTGYTLEPEVRILGEDLP